MCGSKRPNARFSVDVTALLSLGDGRTSPPSLYSAIRKWPLAETEDMGCGEDHAGLLSHMRPLEKSVNFPLRG